MATKKNAAEQPKRVSKFIVRKTSASVGDVDVYCTVGGNIVKRTLPDLPSAILKARSIVSSGVSDDNSARIEQTATTVIVMSKSAAELPEA